MFSKILSIFTSKKNAVKNETKETHEFPDKDSQTHQILIKGNINAKGQKIYHVPNGRFYSVTQADAVFKTEDEAQEAGYRKSRM